MSGNTDKKETRRIDKEQGFYNDDLSRKAVGRLFNDDVIVHEDAPPAKSGVTVKQALSEAEIEQQDKDYIDYINRTSQRSSMESEPKVHRKAMPKSSRDIVDEFAHPKDSSEYEEKLPAYSTGGLEPKFIVVGACAFVLIIFVFLIVQINTSKSQLQKAKDEITAYEKQSAEYESIKMENDDLQIKNEAYVAQINELRLQIADRDIIINSMSKPPTDSATPNTGSTTSTGTVAGGAQGGKTHTVAKGETLWGIAAQYYGDGSKYKDIAAANSLSENATIQEGMKLSIP